MLCITLAGSIIWELHLGLQTTSQPTCWHALSIASIRSSLRKSMETRRYSQTRCIVLPYCIVCTLSTQPNYTLPDLTNYRIFAWALYLIGSFILYHTIFDKRMMQHPRFLKNQVAQEIAQGLSSIPVISLLTAPFFVAEIRGFSKLYDFSSESPFWGYTLLQYPLFILFTDSGIYWIHRGLHHPWVYRWCHKPHHKWVVPTPFASYAFHPLDGWAQSLPYHVFPLLFPLQKCAYLGLFIFVTLWTVLIRELPSPRSCLWEFVTNSLF